VSISSDVIERLPRVEGLLNYLAPMAEKPMNLTYDPPTDGGGVAFAQHHDMVEAVGSDEPISRST
jgi:hypothetical protein